MVQQSLDIAEGVGAGGANNNKTTTNRFHCGKVKKRNTAAIVIFVVIAASLAIAYRCKFYADKEYDAAVAREKVGSSALIPPNPQSMVRPTSPSVLRRFSKAAVCVDDVHCAQIGRDILEKNGSAVDAAIAALFCNGMVTMQSMGIGGGFFMTIYSKEEGKVYALNARETAPGAAKNEMFRANKFISQKGPLAIGVPGELKGYHAAHQRFGRLPWNELIEPTVQFCREGYTMSKHQHQSAISAKINQTTDPTLREWFVVNDTLKPVGSKIMPHQFCDTLEMIAKKGAEDFYSGELADILIEDVQEMGGILTKEDLQNYTVEWTEPVSVELKNGMIVHSVPPPASGLLLAFILNILEGYNFTRESVGDVESTINTYHLIIEAFKYAYALRTELGDMKFVNATELIGNLTSKLYAEGIRDRINPNQTSNDPQDYGAIYYNQPDHGTAHVSVMSDNGDAVSVTSSVNIFFGANMVSRRTGILLNDVMDDFSFPYFKNYFGLLGSPNNRMEPHKRPLSSMAPAIVVDGNGDAKLVIGAAGGTKITTSIALVIMQMLWFDGNLKEAIDTPRIHHQLYPMAVDYEYGVAQPILDGLRARGHNMSRATGAGSVICALYRDRDRIWANADYRKGGDVSGI